jgi:hypothetical protein
MALYRLSSITIGVPTPEDLAALMIGAHSA